MPAIGPAYGLETFVDVSLRNEPDVYFEAGDHLELIRVTGDQFEGMLQGCRTGSFSEPGDTDEFRS